MGRRNRAALLPTQLPQLQNLIKRDPVSYKAEFLQQYRHYQSTLSIFCLKPTEEAKELCELVTFISQVSSCYPQDTAEFPQQIIDLLQEHCIVLHPEVRKSFVQALILLRNKQVIDNSRLLPLFFNLFKCRDKALRELLYNHIVNDIKNANLKAKNNKLNRSLQTYVLTILESVKTGNSDENAVAAKKGVDVCVDLYQKNVWDDAKTVSVIAEACFSPVSKIAVTAIRFFLHTNDDEDDQASESEDDMPDVRKMKQAAQYSGKSKAKSRKLEAAKKKVKRKNKNKDKAEAFNFSALHLLNDPQGFAEKLYSKLAAKEDRWEVRLLRMNLISRVIGIHQLSLLGFYTTLIKYLQPSQRDVTRVLVAAAQASHPLVPPDALEPVVKAIANNFVTDRVANEVIAVGLNGIREICARQPLAMDETLLQDLTQYKNHRDKGVLMGARSLITLFREVNPEMLLRKDRGRAAVQRLKDGSIQTLQFGETGNSDGLQGIEMLDAAEKAEEEAWKDWEIDEDSSSSDDEGWVDVSDDENEFVKVAMSDDEDDEDEDRKKKEPTESSEVDGAENAEAQRKRRIGKRQLKKLREEQENSEEAREKLRQELAAKRAADEEKRQERLAIASTRILTPADFAKLNELKENKEIEMATGKRAAEEEVSESTILGPRKKAKMDYEARMASIEEGRADRPKFGSKKGSKERGSTTNREKTRNKNFMMVAHKWQVVAKGKRSLVDKQKQLRAAINKQKTRKR